MNKKRIRKDLIVVCSVVVVCALGIAVFNYIDPWNYGAELPEDMYIAPWGTFATSEADIGDFVPSLVVAVLSVFVVRQAQWAKMEYFHRHSCDFAVIRIIYKQIYNKVGGDTAIQPDIPPVLRTIPLI